MTLQSMTGFATISGQSDGADWVWEIRSVNGRGLDVRPRLPEGAETLEPVIRAEIGKKFNRGNVSVQLKLSQQSAEATPTLNVENLRAVIAAAAQAQNIATEAGLEMQAASIGELLTQPFVWDAEQGAGHQWVAAAKAQIPALLDQFANARTDEGNAIAAILTGQVDTAETLSKSARKVAQQRVDRAGSAIREKVLALLEITELADEDRLAQELALIAVKADVVEELDRLDAHVAAARALLAKSGPVGRKFDFLMQEFNREANTLCSKSNDTDLTAIGLELKLVIDQMREQVQNLE